ncbi:hypothetical protein BJY04DRAFT_163041 [Aspergillus karnatakaensis]|uniref:uncharacterized protein n=1 Tax=Aspergillus karnatakaensis TaxID=1810916 RepID=UPI003CCD09F7
MMMCCTARPALLALQFLLFTWYPLPTVKEAGLVGYSLSSKRRRVQFWSNCRSDLLLTWVRELAVDRWMGITHCRELVARWRGAVIRFFPCTL